MFCNFLSNFFCYLHFWPFLRFYNQLKINAISIPTLSQLLLISYPTLTSVRDNKVVWNFLCIFAA